jgi:hypothetical protein
MAVSSAGLRPKSDCSGKAQKQFNSKLQTRPLDEVKKNYHLAPIKSIERLHIVRDL